MKFILYSTFILLLAPCNEKKAASSATAQDASAKPKAIIITYEKSACFGSCPSFKMTIDSEKKKAFYKGNSHVDKIGNYEKNISEAEITKLAAAFDKSGFFEMKDEYTSEIPDLPSRYVSYSLDGKLKKIKDRQSAPAELKELEKMLDVIADSDGWERVKDEAPQE